MSVIGWASGINGTWAQASDWSGGVVPTMNDTVSISVGGTYTVTVAAAAAAGSLLLANQTATLNVASTLIAGNFADQQSEVQIQHGGLLAVTTGLANLGQAGTPSSATIDGLGSFQTGTAVTTTVQAALNAFGQPVTELTLGGGITWSNLGTVIEAGGIVVGDGTGESAHIVNSAGALIDFTNLDSSITTDKGASGLLTNAGTLKEAAAGDTTNVSVGVASSGTIALAAGTLQLNAGSNIGGTVSGAGVLAFGAGDSMLTAATTGNLLIDGGVLTVSPSSTIAGNINITSGTLGAGAGTITSVTASGAFSATQGTISLTAHDTLNLTDGADFGNFTATGATVDGGGTLSLGAGTVNNVVFGANVFNTPQVELTLGGNATLSNAGTLVDSGIITVGNASGNSGNIVNAVGGTLEFDTNVSGIGLNNGAKATLTNAGTILQSTNTGTTTTIAASTTSTGVIDLESGTLNLAGPNNSIGGTISGLGTLSFSAGRSVLTGASNTSLLVDGGVVVLNAAAGTTNSDVTVSSGHLTVGTAQTVDGSVLVSGGELFLSGAKLTASALAVDGSGLLTGAGQLAGIVADNGTIEAQRGTLTVDNTVSGSGTFLISGASDLALLGSVNVAGISFLAGAGEELQLGKPGSVVATINGFGSTDTIDLLKTAATGLSFTNNQLTIENGANQVAVLDFASGYSQTNFALASDGAGGTLIQFVPNHASLVQDAFRAFGHVL
jgi:hypothetical protein